MFFGRVDTPTVFYEVAAGGKASALHIGPSRVELKTREKLSKKSSYAATGARKFLRTLARLAVWRKKRAKGPRPAATMTAAGRLGRLAALLLLPALARG